MSRKGTQKSRKYKFKNVPDSGAQSGPNTLH